MIVEVWANFETQNLMVCKPKEPGWEKIGEIEALCSGDAEIILDQQMATIGIDGIIQRGRDGMRMKDPDYHTIYESVS